MHLSRFCHVACLWSACTVICLSVSPASAQVAAPVSAPAALTPLQGAKAVLDRAHNAKSIAALNGDLTNETAGLLGFGLVLTNSMLSGLSSTMTSALSPKGTAAHQNAAETAFQNKVVALLNRYSLSGKAVDASNKSGKLPPGLARQGHQFLTDAVALSDAYEKTHSPNKDGTLSSQFGKNDFPASSVCTFHVLSPTRVKIVPRSVPKSPIEAHLEDGQWRLDLGDLSSGGGTSDSSQPEMKTVTPQAAAFLESIKEEDAAAVEKSLKAHPSLANSPMAFVKGQSGLLTDLPLSLTAFMGNSEIAALLLRYGAKVNAEDHFQETALDEAARFSSKRVAALLLAHGANITHKDASGQTALHRAVLGDDPGTVSLMLAHGAAVNARDEDGKTPLDLALEMPGQNADKTVILALLRRHGATK